MKIYQLTDKGKRKENQDFIYIDKLQSGAFFYLISDGMGGYEKGDIAARIVSENIFTFINYSKEINRKNIQQAINKANLAVKQFNNKNNIKSGATIGGLVLDKQIAHIFWVGDVMIYKIRDNTVSFTSTSHTLKNSLLEIGNIEDIKILNKYKHIVTRSISGKPSESEIGYFSESILKGDLFIICSDGVHNAISVSEIQLLYKKENFLQELKDYLDLHSQDNYSLITFEI